MKPFEAYEGAKVVATMQLDIASKELFTLSKMTAFKKSIAAAIGVEGVGEFVNERGRGGYGAEERVRESIISRERVGLCWRASWQLTEAVIQMQMTAK